MLPYYEACSRTGIQWTIKRSLFRLQLLASYLLANLAVFAGVFRTSHCWRRPRPHYRTSAVVLDCHGQTG